MKYNITAIEHDGLNERTLTITLESLGDKPIDILNAVKQASQAYIATEDGLKTYLYNCKNFNWADFEAYVPNEICEQFGFAKVDSKVSDEEVNWDESLVDEPHFHVSNIQWDLGDFDKDNEVSPLFCHLPSELTIGFTELLADDEQLGDVTFNELKDRVIDYLSDEYGCGIFSISECCIQ